MQISVEINKKFQEILDEKYREILKGVTRVALIDQPEHRNLGDTFIWLGQLDTLKRIGVQVVYKSTTRDIPEYIESLDGDVAILLHGGGNLGDLYTLHESLRREIVRRFPSRKIVFLPQTIYFKSKENLQISRDIYAQHPDLTIVTRVEGHLEGVEKEFSSNKVIFCPDSALGLEPKRTEKNLLLDPVLCVGVIRRAWIRRILIFLRASLQTGSLLQSIILHGLLRSSLIFRLNLLDCQSR